MVGAAASSGSRARVHTAGQFRATSVSLPQELLGILYARVRGGDFEQDRSVESGLTQGFADGSQVDEAFAGEDVIDEVLDAV